MSKSQVTVSPVWIVTSARSPAAHVAWFATVEKHGVPPVSAAYTVTSCAAPATLTPATTAPAASAAEAASRPRRRGLLPILISQIS